MRIGLDDPPHEPCERLPGVALIDQGSFSLGDITFLPFAGQASQQLFFARVAAIERTDADAGALGDGGDWRFRVSREDLPRRFKNQQIVARRLRLTPTQAPVSFQFHGPSIGGTNRSVLLYWNG